MDIITNLTAFFKGFYQHLRWKGKLAIWVFVVLAPIFTVNKIATVFITRPLEIARCQDVIAGKVPEKRSGDKEFYCPALIKKHGATT